MLNVKFILILLVGSAALFVAQERLISDEQFSPCKKQSVTPIDECKDVSSSLDDGAAGDPQHSTVEKPNLQDLLHAKSLAMQIDIGFLMNDVNWLADDARQGRASGTSAEDEVAQWLAQRYASLRLQAFKQLGLSSYVHTFTYRLDDDYLQGENIIGVLPGTANANEYVVVSAHYDHLGIKEGEIYNGADDDASGVAAMLEIARVFIQADIRPEKSIVFIAFSGEELGHIGSGNFCYEMYMQRSVEDLTVLNLEMLGAAKGKGTYVNIWDQENALTQPIIAAVAAASKQLDFPLVVSTGLDPGSDAVELLECKIAATTMDVGGDEAFYDNHPHYHSPDDDPEHIDEDGFHKAVQVATIATWLLASTISR